MAARIGTLLGFAQTVLRALWRAVVWLVGGLWRSTGRAARVWELGRALRRLERQRRDDLETLGKLVYVLFKRSLVRNSDLLAQCEKIRGLDVDIDQLLEAGDRARTHREPAEELLPRVADTPAEFEPPEAARTTLG